MALFLLIMLHALTILAPQVAHGEMYKWTNADGTIGIADDLSKVPPQYREQAKKNEKRRPRLTAESITANPRNRHPLHPKQRLKLNRHENRKRG